MQAAHKFFWRFQYNFTAQISTTIFLPNVLLILRTHEGVLKFPGRDTIALQGIAAWKLLKIFVRGLDVYLCKSEFYGSEMYHWFCIVHRLANHSKGFAGTLMTCTYLFRNLTAKHPLTNIFRPRWRHAVRRSKLRQLLLCIVVLQQWQNPQEAWDEFLPHTTGRQVC